MEITQDDLLALTHLRAAWHGGAARIQSANALAASPGRAEGRVAHWALGRLAAVLEHAARRPLSIGDHLAPSRDEMQIVRAARALAVNDWREAESIALWLVRKDAVSAMTQALAPAACALYGKAACRRRHAASA